jgi:hypothetical protein
MTNPKMITLFSLTKNWKLLRMIDLYLSGLSKCFHSYIDAVKNCGWSTGKFMAFYDEIVFGGLLVKTPTKGKKLTKWGLS